MASSGTEPSGAGRWASWVLPSIPDVLFIALFLSLLSGTLSLRLLGDGDVGWHIRSGQHSLETRTIPRADTFSSAMEGRPWFAWEWLYDLFVGALDRWAGLNGVVWFAALIVAATFAGVFQSLLRRGTNLFAAAGLTLLAVAVAGFHLYARPHIVSWLMTWLWFAILEGWERGWIQSRALYCLPALMVLWVNLHGGFLLGVAILACFWLGEVGEVMKAGDEFQRVIVRNRARPLSIVLLMSIAATFVNPYGYHLHVHIYRYLTNQFLMNHIDEFRSPDFHSLSQQCFAAILLLTIVVLTRAPRLRISHLLLVVLAVYSGLYASRNLPTAAILLVLIAGPALDQACSDGWWGARFGRGGGRVGKLLSVGATRSSSVRGHAVPIASVAIMALVVGAGGHLGGWRIVNAVFDSLRFPVHAAAVIAALPSRDPVFAPDYWGGYLIYSLPSDIKVVVDDRHDLYGEAFFRKYLDLVHVAPGWNDVLTQWKVRRVLMPQGSALANILREEGNWEITHEDSVAVLFEERVPNDKASQADGSRIIGCRY